MLTSTASVTLEEPQSRVLRENMSRLDQKNVPSSGYLLPTITNCAIPLLKKRNL